MSNTLGATNKALESRLRIEAIYFSSVIRKMSLGFTSVYDNIQSSSVYLMSCTEFSVYKVGFSSNPIKRAKEISKINNSMFIVDRRCVAPAVISFYIEQIMHGYLRSIFTSPVNEYYFCEDYSEITREFDKQINKIISIVQECVSQEHHHA